MIIDFNAYLGGWPFRRLRYNTPESLITLMDKAGIDCAVVSSSSILYRNAHEGNLELAEQISRVNDSKRLVPFAIVNPSYSGWKEDVHECVNKLNMKGLRIHPNYHDYKLNDDCATELFKVAYDMNLPVSIVLRMEDERQHHWLVRVPPVPVYDIIEVINRFPDIKFILTYIHYREVEPILNACPDKENFYIEITSHYLFGAYPNQLQLLLNRIGADKILFGSGMPLKYPEAALIKIQCLDISSEDKEKILHKNAEEILGL
ncbi:TPA: metal-dependent hydrolase [Candidatus Bathyarchaeota archaeon]|nr:metal-dependent hydrolase [Candidatus Bathyarchaeota archaeon]